MSYVEIYYLTSIHLKNFLNIFYWVISSIVLLWPKMYKKYILKILKNFKNFKKF